MPTLVETLSWLRGEFARSAAGDLIRLQKLVSRLEGEPGDRAALEELMRGFHGLAGSGGTFGFPQVSTLAGEGERQTSSLLAAGEAPDAAARRQLGVLLDGVEAELNVPRVEPAAAAPPAERERPAGDVLIAAADEATHRCLSPLLRLAGFDVRSARSEGAARCELKRALPDVLVTCGEFPDGSGYRLADFLRQLPRGDEPTILLLGSGEAPCDLSAAIYAGVDGVLDRPLDWSDLARQLGQLYAGRASAGRILAVEGDAHHAAYVSAILEAEGYEVRVCAEPSLFGAELDAFRPHLVLMDVLLPGASGYELVRTLRRNDFHATLPVLFLTTEGQIKARIESVQVGGDDHLVKPVSSPLLLSAVAARIERGRLLDGGARGGGRSRGGGGVALAARPPRGSGGHRRRPGHDALPGT